MTIAGEPSLKAAAGVHEHTLWDATDIHGTSVPEKDDSMKVESRTGSGRSGGRLRRRGVGLGLALALTLGACASDGGGGTSETDGTGGAEETPATANPAGEGQETSAAGNGGCDDADPVDIGAIFSLTGPAADIGARGEEGVNMAVEHVNAEGGILGRCLEAHFGDDEGDPTRASQVARELVDQVGVDFVVGPFLSSPTGTTVEVTNRANMVQIFGSVLQDAGDPTSFPYAFRVQVAAALQAQTFAEFMKTAGYETAGIIAVNNDLGIGVSEAFQSIADAEGLEVTTAEFHESGDADHTAQMQTLQGTDPDVLIIMSTAVPDLVASVRARNGLGWDVPTVGFSSLAFPEVTEAIGPEGMEGVLAGQAFRNLSRDADGNILGGERVAQWLDQYREFVGAETLENGPQQVASFYDAVTMVADAANATESLEADQLRSHLESEPYEGIMATYEYSGERHDGVTLDDLVFVIARSFEDGTYEVAPQEDV